MIREDHARRSGTKTVIIVVISVILLAEIILQFGGLSLIGKADLLQLNYNPQKFTSQNKNVLYQYALDLINKDRKDHNLSPVELSNNTSAQNHADDMLETNYFSHWNSLGVKPYVTYSQTGGRGEVAENIAYHYSFCKGVLCIPTPFDPQKMIDDSEHSMVYNDSASDWGHRDNILDPNHTHVSIGVAYNDNRFYFVEHFETNIIDWQKIRLYGTQLEMVGVLPKGQSISSIDIYDDPSPQILTGQELENSPPYNLGYYDQGRLVGEIVKPPPPGHSYVECSAGKIAATTTNNQNYCLDYVVFDNKSRYSNGIDFSVDVSKWIGHGGIHTIYVNLIDEKETIVPATSLTLEYLR